jgi:nickel-dependent lactate racemase
LYPDYFKIPGKVKINLAYGKLGLEWEVPDGYHVDIIEPRWVEGLKDQTSAVTDALRSPIDSKALKDLVSRDMKIGIIFSDITRATPYHIILPALLQELDHIAPQNITLFCATGTHRPAPPGELETILGKEIAGKYRIVQNDTHDRSQYMHAGNTSSGNRIYLNAEMAACDLKILTGFIEPHFFMGFSGGGKAVMPGMAYIDTIRYNHSISMLENENARWGITVGNPLWEDVLEAAEMLPDLFLLNITLNKNREISGVYAGDLRSAHEAGCKFARETAMARVNEPYDLVITSNSGYPLDLNIYQSIKGMSAAMQVVKQGGDILIAAECWDGIPDNTDFARMLDAADNIDDLYEYVRKNEKDFQDTWQVFYEVLIQRWANVSLYTDKLDDDTVRRALFNPVRDPGASIREILAKYGRDARICVLPEGPLTIPYIKN